MPHFHQPVQKNAIIYKTVGSRHLLTWHSHKQPIVAMSSAEAELIALSTGSCLMIPLVIFHSGACASQKDYNEAK
eukprot:5136564-Amphidinium_carterae.1